MNRTRCGLCVVVASLMTGAAISAGGWAVITVDDVPEYIRANQPVTIRYTVLQHGARPVNGLNGRIEARAGGREVLAHAHAGTEEGHYTATVTLPDPGEWSLTIHSGFAGHSALALLPLRVVDGTARPSPMSAEERGRQLFVAKGCVTCHSVSGTDLPGTIRQGPPLLPHKYESGFLARILANPASIPRAAGYPFRMPNLSLDSTEIDALVAFINPRPSATNTSRRR